LDSTIKGRFHVWASRVTVGVFRQLLWIGRWFGVGSAPPPETIGGEAILRTGFSRDIEREAGACFGSSEHSELRSSVSYEEMVPEGEDLGLKAIFSGEITAEKKCTVDKGSLCRRLSG
jgi:hypothetical protein